MSSITNSFNIININHFLIYNCQDAYPLNDLDNSVKQKIRRIYTFSGPNNSNILRWSPNDLFSQFLSLEPNKLYWVESLASNFTPYVLLEECVAITPDPTPTPTATPTPTPTPLQAGNNSANYNNQAVWNGDSNITTVGSNGGPSAYGTYDQSGNVWEWNEDVIFGFNRVIRGGPFTSPTSNGVSSTSRSAPSNPGGALTENFIIGFRLSSLTNPLSLDFAIVNDINNSVDANGYGSVSYGYHIGNYTVTNCEYVDFLNAVATIDTYNLYNTQMGSDIVRGGISRSGSSESYIYSVKSNMGNKPVVYVNWLDAARYCNWLHNDKPTGVQNSSTTEDGAYTLNGATTELGLVRNANASYYIPTENEWYKAAYYKSGGPDAGYWTYATQRDSVPTPVNASEIGNGLINGQPANDSDYVCA